MKPKILIIYYKNLFPFNSGDKKVIKNHINILSQKYRIDILHFPDNLKGVNKKKFKKIDKIVSFKSNFKIKLINLIKNFKFKKPIQIALYFNKKAYQWIKKHLNEYHALYPHFFRSAELVRNFNKKKILHLHDALSLNYSSAIKQNIPLIKKILYKYEIKKLLEYEKQCIHDFDKTFLVSDFDNNYLNKNNITSNKLTTIPITVPEKLLNIKNNEETNNITFLGKMDYIANIDAMEYFVNNIFPEIPKKYNLKIIGSNPTAKIEKLKTNRIEITGYIEDPYPIIKNSKIFIAPIRMGSGTQVKVLEAMALGKCVIATEIVKNGINAIHGKEIIYAKNKNDFIEKINYFLENDKKRKNIESNAYKFIKNNHTNNIIRKKLINFFS